MNHIKRALSLVLIVGLAFATPIDSDAKSNKESKESSSKNKVESSQSKNVQNEDEEVATDSTSTQEDLKEVDNKLKKQVKKDIQQLKKEAKKAYSQEEIQKIQEAIAEINSKYPGIKTIPVENVISKKLKMKFDTPPVIKSGRTLIPVRAISEGLGAEVTWNAQENKVTITKDGKEIILQLGSNIAYINGVETKLDVPAETMNNRTIVPLRFIAESLGLKVEWDQENETIEVEDQVLEDTSTQEDTNTTTSADTADSQTEQATNGEQDTTTQNDQIQENTDTDNIQNTQTTNN